MNRFRLASLALMAALVPAAAVVAQNGTGGAAPPPPTRPGGGGSGSGDDLRGPRVPGGARDGQRGFGGEGRGRQRGGAGEADAINDRVWMQALDKMSDSLTDEQKTKIKEIREAYRKSVDAWQEAHGVELRELQKQIAEARKSGQEPDAALVEKAKRIGEARPKIDPVKRQIMSVLDPEQEKAHKAAAEALAKERGSREGRGGAGRPGGPGMGDSGAAPSAKDRPARGRGAPPPPAGRTPPSDKPAPPAPPAN